jgi:pimeloyl-ACP methyl ester carboxylesterase
MDALDVTRSFFVGFSMGGMVTLYIEVRKFRGLGFRV